MNPLRIKQYLPGIAWFFLLAVLLAIPGSEFPETDNWFKKLQPDKWIHAGLFGVLAWLFMKPFLKTPGQKNMRVYVLLIMILTSLWGLATEFLQESVVKGRSFDYWDWVADSAGAVIAWLFFNRQLRKINASQNP